MLALVKLSYSTELTVEAEDEEQLYDWLSCTTPEAAYQLAMEQNPKGDAWDEYTEEVLRVYDPETECVADYIIGSC